MAYKGKGTAYVGNDAGLNDEEDCAIGKEDEKEDDVMAEVNEVRVFEIFDDVEERTLHSEFL